MKISAEIFKALLLTCSIVFFMSCITKDDEGLVAPTIEKSSDGQSFVIAFNSMEGMHYANIFRETGTAKSDDSGFENDEKYKCINIGQVTPNDLEKLPNGFAFNDPYTNSSQKYRYFIRYYNNKYYTYTTESPMVVGLKTEGASSEAELTHTDDSNGAPSMTFTSNDDEEDPSYILTLNTDIRLPEEFNILSVILTVKDTPVLSKPFQIEKIGIDKTSTQLLTDTVEAGTEIDLQKKLLASFFDKDLTVEGLIGIKKDTTENANYQRYYWTIPKEVTLTVKEIDADDTENAIEKSTIYVPSLKDATNGFDYSAAADPKDRAALPAAITTDDGILLDFSPYRP